MSADLVTPCPHCQALGAELCPGCQAWVLWVAAVDEAHADDLTAGLYLASRWDDLAEGGDRG